MNAYAHITRYIQQARQDSPEAVRVIEDDLVASARNSSFPILFPLRVSFQLAVAVLQREAKRYAVYEQIADGALLGELEALEG